MKGIVVMNAEGRLTLPAAIRKALGITGETAFETEISDGVLLLRPAIVVPRGDAWAYTPEHRAQLALAREDVRAGRMRAATEADLEVPEQ
jgi:bifunctional DNA-binding transcriptional regulator/antitoxin component of YhaV-PrlF toxin-antitoxin module